MEGVGEVLNIIWNMPWYKVIAIAAADDIIVFIKIWPVYILFFVFAALIYKR
jgi:hypothetical protein